MSFITEQFDAISEKVTYEELSVLRFALQKAIPHFENVAREAKQDRRERCERNVEVANDMLTDIDTMISGMAS